jgi:hyaluronan synthase
VRRAAGWATVAAAAGLVLWWRLAFGNRELNATTAFYGASAAMFVGLLALAVHAPTWRHRPVANGRIIAVIPAFNEEPTLLHRAVQSLLSGTRIPDVVHVVDDGSSPPLPPVIHPRVVWHRQENRGKRAAQANALRHEHADFIVTMDSDSVVAARTLEHSLRALSDRRVQAVTATVGLLNRRTNLLTRLLDLELVTGCLTTRGARSALGAVSPTSGAFSVYRAGRFFENAEDYLASGTAGDDRRLSHYSLLRGRVVAVEDALVTTEMPTTLRQAFRQRVRWYRSYFRYLPWELRHLGGVPLLLRIWNLMLVATWPLLIAAVLVLHPVIHGTFFWPAFAYWLGLLYLHTARYALARPQMNWTVRLRSWLFLTPLLIPWNLFVVRPAMYLAIFKARSLEWHTRQSSPAQPVPA